MTEPAPPDPTTRSVSAPAGTGIYTAQPAGPDGTIGRFVSWLESAPPQPPELREALSKAREELADRFRRGDSIELLVAAHAGIIDASLAYLWRLCDVDPKEFALIAVGGYGRAELHPGSDIDILILLTDASLDTDPVENFVAMLWDTGLEIGHSVRTVDECQRQARDDLTVATTLMESRRLAGNAGLYEQMSRATDADSIWDSSSFFLAKQDEQRSRHLRYDDTGYNLEPNVKGSPGGLRDIQMVGWIAKRHIGARDFNELANHGFMTPGQAARLLEARQFLWTVRYGLHVLTGRREDRLLFDHQKALASLLGYEDSRFTLGVEQMMQRYYRMVMQVARTNEMLLQLFEEDIMLAPDSTPGVIDESFVSRNGYLQAVDDDVFLRDPSALLSVFRLLQQHPELKGVSARTLSLLRRNRHLIDEQFRQHPRNHQLFLDLLRAPRGIITELRRMNRYGILGRYIPAFGRVVGRMQYDLFHAYTVDEHTLFLISHLRKFALRETDDDHVHEVMAGLPDQSIAYLSGLFHDIAKGRGGDHSELGAIDALLFCREHGLSDEDSDLVSWLVANHLVLSMTAQKKDLSDPEVIANFAQRMQTRRRLDYLYALTVADVRATNPSLWNSWKAKLFRDLYEFTADALERGLENPLDQQQVADQSQSDARRILESELGTERLDAIWNKIGAGYFRRHSVEEIVWHTRRLALTDLETPILELTRSDNGKNISIMLYTPQVKHTFAAVTARLDELGLSVLDARIEQLRNQFSLDTYIINDPDGGNLGDSIVSDIRERLLPFIESEEDDVRSVQRRMPRRQRMFNTRTKVSFRDDPNGQTIMELVCADHPGLLFTVGVTLITCGIFIKGAKIVTIGERAEDVFYLTNEQEQPLSETQQAELREALLGALPGGVR